MTDTTVTNAERSVFRYGVPVDDRWHTLGLSGAVLHVACRRPDLVEVWALSGDGPDVPRMFRAFGTGHQLPPAPVQYVGTALAPGGQLVWHLFELDQPSDLSDGRTDDGRYRCDHPNCKGHSSASIRCA